MCLIPMHFSLSRCSILKYNGGKSFFLFPVTNTISSLQSAKTANASALCDKLNASYLTAYLEKHGSV